MSHLLIRRILQVTAGTLAGLAVVALLYLGPPGASMSVGEGPDWDPAVPEPYPAPPLPLVTAEGEAFQPGALEGQVSVVFFGFANCPDVCPLTLANLSRALEILEPSGRAFQGIFVTVDPSRDTPEALRAYMGRFHPDLVALTGSPEAIEETTEAWGIHVAFVEEGEAADPHRGHDVSGSGEEGRAALEQGEQAHPGHAHAAVEAPSESGYGVAHSTRALVVDRDGRVVRTLAPYLAAEDIVAALEPLLR